MTEPDVLQKNIFAEDSLARLLALETKVRKSGPSKTIRKYCPFGR